MGFFNIFAVRRVVDGGLGSLSLRPSLVTTVRDLFWGMSPRLLGAFLRGSYNQQGVPVWWFVCLKAVPPNSNDGCALD